MSPSSLPYCSQKFCKTKNGVLHMLPTTPLLTNTVVTLGLSLNIMKGCVFRFILTYIYSMLKWFKATPRGAELGARFGVGVAGANAAYGASSVTNGISPLGDTQSTYRCYLFVHLSDLQCFPGMNWAMELLFVMLVVGLET